MFQDADAAPLPKFDETSTITRVQDSITDLYFEKR